MCTCPKVPTGKPCSCLKSLCSWRMTKSSPLTKKIQVQRMSMYLTWTVATHRIVHCRVPRVALHRWSLCLRFFCIKNYRAVTTSPLPLMRTVSSSPRPPRCSALLSFNALAVARFSSDLAPLPYSPHCLASWHTQPLSPGRFYSLQ